jgi:hypothetical protein
MLKKLHGRETVLRSQQLLVYSGLHPHFTEPACSLLYSQETATCPNSQPDTYPILFIEDPF